MKIGHGEAINSTVFGTPRFSILAVSHVTKAWPAECIHAPAYPIPLGVGIEPHWRIAVNGEHLLPMSRPRLYFEK